MAQYTRTGLEKQGALTTTFPTIFSGLSGTNNTTLYAETTASA